RLARLSRRRAAPRLLVLENVLMRLISVSAAALALATLIAPAAMAQGSAPTGQPAGGANPLTESKQVGDWTVRCFAVKNESPCDVYQEMQDQNSHQRVLS